MKPLHVGLLIAAGAIGGAVLMKVSEPPRPVEPPPVVAQAPAVQPPPVTTPEPEPQAPPPAAESAPEKRESPFVRHKSAHKDPVTYTKPNVETASAAPAPQPPAPVSPAPEPIAPAPVQPPPPAQPEPEHVTPPPPPEPHRVTLTAGTLIPVRLVDGLTTERNVPGDSFAATLDKELVVDGFVIAERGSRVEGRVVSSDRGGRMSGVASLGVEITRLRLSDGQTVSLSTDSFERHAEASHRDDAIKVGAGAVLGTVIGAIAGGGKGAAIGAGAGTAAGAGTVMATRGRAAQLPSETRISFRLRAPLVVTERVQ